jgi:hypothetical protein
MSLRSPHEDALLTGADITLVRQVLADCSRLLSAAQQSAASPQLEMLLRQATWAATGGRRCPDGLIYYINLAIDYLDFAPPARSSR